MNDIVYSARERVGLWSLAVLGLVGLNGAFVHSLVVRPDEMAWAMTNPLAAAFIAEALVLAPVLGYLLRRWGVSRLHWAWFVVLALLGSIAFALPVAILWDSPARSSKLPSTPNAEGSTR